MIVGAIAGAGVLSAGASVIGSQSAASAQEKAANQANATEKSQYAQTRADLLPYNTAGQTAINQLVPQLPSLASPINMDEATLQKTPGYQFLQQQGLKATQNGYAAKGLGASGAALKGAAAYATGIADNTYQTQFNNELASRQNTYNMLSGVAGLGENAAATTGNYGQKTADQISQNTIGAGNAAAGADIASGAAIGNGLSSIPNALLTNQLLSGSGGLYGYSTQGGGGLLTPAQMYAYGT